MKSPLGMADFKVKTVSFREGIRSSPARGGPLFGGYFFHEKRNSGLEFFGFDCGFGLESPGNNESLYGHLQKWWIKFFVYIKSPLLGEIIPLIVETETTN